MAFVRSQNLFDVMRVMRDWQSFVRTHFIYAALEAGLLEALDRPCAREELIRVLGVGRAEFLDALLDVGLSVRELSCKKGLYRLRGRRSRTMIGQNGDMYAAIVQANVTYYNSAYRHAAERMRGAPSGNYLNEIGGLVARYAKISEPIIASFIRDIISGKDSARILEVGCGSGMFLRSAVESNPNATGIGIDMDPEVVMQATQNLRNWGIGDRFDIVHGDIRTPPVDIEGPFDIITLFNLVYYFSADELSELFRAFRSWLAPEGILALASNMRGNGKDLAAANLNVATTSTVGCTPLPALDDIMDLLKQSGYSSVKPTRLMPRSAFYGITASCSQDNN
jgi:SAM-dependent methyltransferase